MGLSNVQGVPGLHQASRARVIDGAAIAAAVRAEVAERVALLAEERGGPPTLATVLIGDDPASAVYVRSKIEACEEVGIGSAHHHLDAGVPRQRALELIDGLNADRSVSGILCQLPVSEHLDGTELTDRIDPAKDVDGLTAANAGRLALGAPGLRPCTPSGVMEILLRAGVEPRGLRAAVIGRSNLFGKPMAQMLTAADATVTLCHSRTVDPAAISRECDILVVAAGRPRMVGPDWVKRGAVVVDVGINRTEEGLVGDVDFRSVLPRAAAITPVPGGVGPITIACLLRNTLDAAKAATQRSAPSAVVE